MTHGKWLLLTRSVAWRYAACTAPVRSGLMSLPSLVFSGAPMAISASQCSSAWISIAAGFAITSSGACRSQSRWDTSPPPKVRRSSAYAPRWPSFRVSSSTSGRASGVPQTITCQPGWTPRHVSSKSVA